jgi:hypothetical protein
MPSHEGMPFLVLLTTPPRPAMLLCPAKINMFWGSCSDMDRLLWVRRTKNNKESIVQVLSHFALRCRKRDTSFLFSQSRLSPHFESKVEAFFIVWWLIKRRLIISQVHFLRNKACAKIMGENVFFFYYRKIKGKKGEEENWICTWNVRKILNLYKLIFLGSEYLLIN